MLRVQELENEMHQAINDREIIKKFISAQGENLPDVVKNTLQKRIKNLNSVISDCKLRISVHN
ncbi:hypothetical protein [Bacillus sp. BB56-3]|uniref:hypothetical protein n=1 Tax=Bacillus sp. BB56-3 TaxID=2217831 RepID=UPI0011EDB82F|nr:hypothetical protein [Bacillus sp. BB56-3]KAA0784338.1 hypothetical protein DN406_27390 [Bacillus sp. BB56-3]